jgi:hypothetical protein
VEQGAMGSLGSLGFLGWIGSGSASRFAGAGLSINQENMVNQLVQDGRTVVQSRDVLRRVSYKKHIMGIPGKG